MERYVTCTCALFVLLEMSLFACLAPDKVKYSKSRKDLIIIQVIVIIRLCPNVRVCSIGAPVEVIEKCIFIYLCQALKRYFWTPSLWCKFFLLYRYARKIPSNKCSFEYCTALTHIAAKGLFGFFNWITSRGPQPDIYFLQMKHIITG